MVTPLLALVQRRTLRTASSSARRFLSLISGGGSGARRPAAAATPGAAPVYKNPFLHTQEQQGEPDLEPLLSLAPSYELYPNDVHCFLGLNGSGKSRFLNQLQQSADSQAQRGGNSDRRRCRISSLSLDAHREFVARHGEKVVANVLGGVGSPSARDLIVRLGLYPVWESHVKHLSTGEMRKLMLAETLLKVPRANVLILDQPFDGLDVAARKQLEWMLGQLTRGFTRLLVQTGGRNDANAYRTQVLLVANRLEQVFPEILTHMVLLRKQDGSSEITSVSTTNESTNLELLPCQVDEEAEAEKDALFSQLRSFLDEEHHKRPQMTESEMISIVQELFDCQQQHLQLGITHQQQAPAIELRQVSISYDNKRVLLDTIDFARHRHEHWVLLGPNGSGKSSLMRVLMQTPGHGLTAGDVYVGSDNMLHATDKKIGAVSTDQHIQLLHQSVLLQEDQKAGGVTSDKMTKKTNIPTAFDLILEHAKSIEKAHLAAKLLNLPIDAIHTRSLSELSQGEQKLVLIARTLAACPEVLILDEITHGLDPFNRAHVLRVVNAIGEFANSATHLILITHHEDEIVDCFTGVFEIRDKQLVERAVA